MYTYLVFLCMYVQSELADGTCLCTLVFSFYLASKTCILFKVACVPMELC